MPDPIKLTDNRRIVLAALIEAIPKALSYKELAQRTGIYQPTVENVCKDLNRHGYLEKRSINRRGDDGRARPMAYYVAIASLEGEAIVISPEFPAHETNDFSRQPVGAGLADYDALKAPKPYVSPANRFRHQHLRPFDDR